MWILSHNLPFVIPEFETQEACEQAYFKVQLGPKCLSLQSNFAVLVFISVWLVAQIQIF